jgi:hypothetical protein
MNKKTLVLNALTALVAVAGPRRVSAAICKAVKPRTMVGWHAYHCNWGQLVDELFPTNNCEVCSKTCAGAWCDKCSREHEDALDAWWYA